MTLLARRMGVAKARDFIESPRKFSAAQLHALGVIDHVTKAGRGKEVIQNLIAARREGARASTGNRLDGHSAIREAARIAGTPSLGELTQIVDLWIDAALSVSATDLRTMQRLVRSQDRLVARMPEAA